MIETYITLNGEAFQGRYIKASQQAKFVSQLIKVAHAATSFRAYNTSRLKGRAVKFLENIWNIVEAPWTETERGDTVLVFQAPSLLSAAPGLFEQESLFPGERLNGSWTVFDFIGQVFEKIDDLSDGTSGLDQGMLTSIESFSSMFASDLNYAQFKYSDMNKSATIDLPLTQRARIELNKTPPSKRIRMSGTLDMLRVSDTVFQLILDDGSRIRGVWLGEINQIRQMLGTRVVMEGEANFNTAGEIIVIMASAMQPAVAGDAIYSHKPVISGLEAKRKLRVSGQGALKRIIGSWPGDETDEEISDFLVSIK